MIKVVTGVIRRGNRVLLTQRTHNRDFPLHWESPGGKVEDGELPRHALHRELIEEIGLDAEIPGSPMFSASFEPPVVSRAVGIRYYFIDPPTGWVPMLREVLGAGWFTLAEMEHLQLIPGNYVVLRYLQLLAAGGQLDRA